MSAWMFDHDGMNRVVDAIYYAANRGCPTPMTLLMSGTIVGNRLFAMNSQALYDRYGNDPSYNDPPKGYSYQKSNADEIQMCKTLHCYLYQCSEGDIPESGTFKQVEAISKWFDARLGYNTDGMWENPANQRKYDAAEWG